MRRRGEAAGQCHVDDRHIGLQQKRTGFLETQFQIIAFGRAVEIAAEQALQLPGGESGLFGQQAWRQGILEVGFHFLDD